MGIKNKLEQNVNVITMFNMFYDMSKLGRENVVEKYNPLELPIKRQRQNMFYICRGIKKHKIHNLSDKEKDKGMKYIKKTNREQRFCWSHESAMEYMERRYGKNEVERIIK